MLKETRHSLIGLDKALLGWLLEWFEIPSLLRGITELIIIWQWYLFDRDLRALDECSLCLLCGGWEGSHCPQVCPFWKMIMTGKRWVSFNELWSFDVVPLFWRTFVSLGHTLHCIDRNFIGYFAGSLSLYLWLAFYECTLWEGFGLNQKWEENWDGYFLWLLPWKQNRISYILSCYAVIWSPFSFGIVFWVAKEFHLE